MRRLVPLVLLAFVGAACGGVPGGEVTSATPDTIVGTVATQPAVTVPAEYAKGDAAAGKQVFAQSGCVACHTLADAGASGTVGPNLDEAKPPLGLVVDRVLHGKGAMPPFQGQLTTKQIADVAAYVVGATHG